MLGQERGPLYRDTIEPLKSAEVRLTCWVGSNWDKPGIVQKELEGRQQATKAKIRQQFHGRSASVWSYDENGKNVWKGEKYRDGETNDIWYLDVKGVGRIWVYAFGSLIDVFHFLLLELPPNPNCLVYPQLPLCLQKCPLLGMSNVWTEESWGTMMVLEAPGCRHILLLTRHIWTSHNSADIGVIIILH